MNVKPGDLARIYKPTDPRYNGWIVRVVTAHGPASWVVDPMPDPFYWAVYDTHLRRIDNPKDGARDVRDILIKQPSSKPHLETTQ